MNIPGTRRPESTDRAVLRLRPRRRRELLTLCFLVPILAGGCVKFGWDRLSTRVPDAVLDTMESESVRQERDAIAAAARNVDQGFAMSGALRHLASRLGRLGLESSGEQGFLQPVPLTAILVESVHLQVGSRVFVQGQDLVLGSLDEESRLALRSPLVFVGHGVVAPERERDDFQGLDLQNKIALMLAGPSDSSYVDTWYADWRYQCAEAARRGAVGVLLVHPGNGGEPEAGLPPPPRDWNATLDQFQGPRFVPRAASGDSIESGASPRFEAWIPREAGDELLRAEGIDPARAWSAARTSGFRGRELSLAAKLEAETRRTPAVSYNLIAQISGRYSAEQSILIAASLDGSEASFRACAALLELAKGFCSLAEEPARSVVFVVFGAGTSGRRQELGAEGYLRRPVRELSQCAAALVLDGGLPEGLADDVTSATADTLVCGGLGDSELGTLFRAAAEADGLLLRDERDRSRWFEGAAPAIARRGIPAATVGCERADLRAAMRVGFHMAQTRGSPRWDQHSAFRFFPR